MSAPERKEKVERSKFVNETRFPHQMRLMGLSDDSIIIIRRNLQAREVLARARQEVPLVCPTAPGPALERASVSLSDSKVQKKPNPSVGKGRLRLSSGEGNEYGILD